MNTGLRLAELAAAMARHAAARHAVLAENVANADTPGYRAKDVAPFADVFDKATKDAAPAAREIVGARAKPNGNTVSLEEQMALTGAARRDHETATAIYAKSLDMLRAAIGRQR